MLMVWAGVSEHTTRSLYGPITPPRRLGPHAFSSCNGGPLDA
jgi:hypothetical protein